MSEAITHVNRTKLRSLGYDKVLTACDRHASEYKRHRAAGNTRMMGIHKSLMMHCATVAVEMNQENREHDTRQCAHIARDVAHDVKRVTSALVR